MLLCVLETTFEFLGICHWIWNRSSVQFTLVAPSCPTLCDLMNRSTPGLPVHHQVPESTQTHVHWVGDAIQPSHPLSSPSPPALNLSQHQGLFKWVSSLHQVAKVEARISGVRKSRFCQDTSAAREPLSIPHTQHYIRPRSCEDESVPHTGCLACLLPQRAQGFLGRLCAVVVDLNPSRARSLGRVLVIQFGCPRVQNVMLSFVLRLRTNVFLSSKGLAARGKLEYCDGCCLFSVHTKLKYHR